MSPKVVYDTSSSIARTSQVEHSCMYIRDSADSQCFYWIEMGGTGEAGSAHNYSYAGVHGIASHFGGSGLGFVGTSYHHVLAHSFCLFIAGA